MSIRLKLILSFLLVALVGIVIVGLLAGRVTANEFGEYVFRQSGEAVAGELAELYQENGGWEKLRPSQFGGMGAMRGQGHMGGAGMPGNPLAVVNMDDNVVVPGGGFELGQRVPKPIIQAGVPIEVDGQQVGTVLAGGPRSALITPAGEEFLGRVNRALILGGASAVTVAILLAALLAGQLTGALRKLTDATRTLAGGQFGQQVEVKSKDEVGELAEAFNQMSADLAEAERLRRQMSADIAHELRTPLSLILGQSEAMLDQVMPTTEDNLQVVHQEARRLNRIVEDLRTLSLAEAGELSINPRLVSPVEIIQRTIKARQALALSHGVELKANVPPTLPTLQADPDRLEQALGNMLDNAMRHSPAEAPITLSAQATSSSVNFVVDDSGPGIDPADLPHIFNRFYRADRARSREQGGSGLGLAIARSIARSHGGELTAANRPAGGARFTLRIPIG